MTASEQKALRKAEFERETRRLNIITPVLVAIDGAIAEAGFHKEPGLATELGAWRKTVDTKITGIKKARAAAQKAHDSL